MQHLKRLPQTLVLLTVLALSLTIVAAPAGAAVPGHAKVHITHTETDFVPITITNGNMNCPFTDARSCGLDRTAGNTATFSFKPTNLTSITNVVITVNFRGDCVGNGEQFAAFDGVVGDTLPNDPCTDVVVLDPSQGVQQSDLDVFGPGGGSFQAWMEPGSANAVSASARVTGQTTQRSHCHDR